MTARLLTLLGLAWPAVTIAAPGALSEACRYVELGHVDAFLAVGDTGEVWGGRTEAEIAREVRRERRGAA